MNREYPDPFHVNTQPSPWTAPDARSRITGLNALGQEGTNVHVAVEQPPQHPACPQEGESSRRYHVLPVSARTEAAAAEAVRGLGGHLAEAGPDTRLADVAYTLQTGPKTFEHRRAGVVRRLEDAVGSLTGAEGATPLAARAESAQGRPVALLLAGIGEQYPGLVGELHRREPVFRAELDACLDRLSGRQAGIDAADLLAGDRADAAAGALAAALGRTVAAADGRAEAIARTELAQPLMFAVDYALARTLISWGLRPSALLGYSLGEYVAAALSGVLTLDEALALVVHRARLIADLPGGAMAAVPLGPGQLRGRFRLEARGLDVAAANGADMTVVAGPREAIDRLARDLARSAVPLRRLSTTHAFHSRMLEPAAEELVAWVSANIHPGAPQIPYLSNVTGDWASPELVADPRYWARHMTGAVRFADGVTRLLADPELALVEIGPGPSLGAMVRAQCPPTRWPLIAATLPSRDDPRPADEVLTECLARLWLTGVELDWTAYHRREGRNRDARGLPDRIPLPTHPSQWEAPAVAEPARAAAPPEPEPDPRIRPVEAGRRETAELRRSGLETAAARRRRPSPARHDPETPTLKESSP